MALASDETTMQLNTFTGFRVASYMAEGDNPRLAATMFLPEQMEIMIEAVLAVVGNGVTSEDALERLAILEHALHEGLTLLRVHCRKYRAKACVAENRALLSALIDEDMKAYAQRLFVAAVAAAKAGPPAIEDMPPVVTPKWQSLGNYIRGGGLMDARATPAVAAVSVRGEKRPRSTGSGGGGRFGVCYTWRDYGTCSFGTGCM